MRSLVSLYQLCVCILTLWVFAGVQKSSAQQAQLDSMRTLFDTLRQFSPDTGQVNLANNLSRAYWYRSYDSAMQYARIALSWSIEKGFYKGKAEALKSIGTIMHNQGNSDSALIYYQQSLSLYQQLGMQSGVAVVYNGVGLVHLAQGEFAKATESLFASLRIREQLGNINDIGTALLNIGILLKQQGKLDDALEYYKRALTLKERVGEKSGISNAYNTIGEIYHLQKNYQRALEYHSNALRLRQELGNKHGIATSLNALGRIYLEENKPTLAFNYFMGAMSIRTEMHDVMGQITVGNNISRALQKQTRYPEALQYALRALEHSDSIKALQQRQSSLARVAEVYEAMGKYQEAMRYFRDMLNAKDSMYREESSKRVAEIETKYQVEKKEQEIQILLEREDNSKRQMISLIVGASMMFILVLVLINRYRLKVRNEQEIQLRRSELEERSIELERANSLLLSKNDELEALNTKLQQVSKDKDEFLGIATHDLKNPLSAVLLTAGMGDALIQEIPDHPNMPVLKYSFLRIVETARHMLDIINGLLDVHRIETLGLSPFIASHDAGELLRHTVLALESGAITKFLTIHVHVPEEQVLVYADHVMLNSVLRNIISNAIKFTPKGKHIYCSVQTVSSDDEQDFVRFSVRDEGPGLTDTDKQHLFQKFMRLSAQPTGGEHSTGLGLSVAKKMVDAMNGSLVCQSKYGEGAEFIVDLPLSTDTTPNNTADTHIAD
jgi:signal transduction histidine kinase